MPLGPFLDLSVGRTHFAPVDIKKMALRKPKGLEPTKLKNVSRNVFGEKIGRLHMKVQDMDKLQTRKMKGLKVRKGKGGDASSATDDNDMDEE